MERDVSEHDEATPDMHKRDLRSLGKIASLTSSVHNHNATLTTIIATPQISLHTDPIKPRRLEFQQCLSILPGEQIHLSIAQNLRLRQLLHERPPIRIRTERIIDRIHNPLNGTHLPQLRKLPHSEEGTRRAPNIRTPHPIERRVVA